MTCSVPIEGPATAGEVGGDGGRGRYPGAVSEASTPRPDPAGPVPPARPRRLTVAAVLTALEGAAVALFGLAMLVVAVAGETDDVTQSVTGGLTLLLLAALPLAAALGLWWLRRWSRGPAVVTQILALPSAWHLYGAGGGWQAAGVLLGAVAVVVLVAVVSPAAAAALGVLDRRTVRDAGAGPGE